MTPIKAVMMKWIARRAKKNEKCETTHNIDEPKKKKNDLGNVVSEINRNVEDKK